MVFINQRRIRFTMLVKNNINVVYTILQKKMNMQPFMSIFLFLTLFSCIYSNTYYKKYETEKTQPYNEVFFNKNPTLNVNDNITCMLYSNSNELVAIIKYKNKLVNSVKCLNMLSKSMYVSKNHHCKFDETTTLFLICRTNVIVEEDVILIKGAFFFNSGEYHSI